MKPAGWRQLLPPAHPVPSPRLFFFFFPTFLHPRSHLHVLQGAQHGPKTRHRELCAPQKHPIKYEPEGKPSAGAARGAPGGAAPQFHYLQQGNLLRLGRNPKWHLSPPNRYLSLSINPLSIVISPPAPRARSGRSPRGASRAQQPLGGGNPAVGEPQTPGDPPITGLSLPQAAQ